MVKKLAVLLVFLLIAPVTQAASVLNKPEHFTVRYGVYSGGFQALDISIAFDFSARAYQADMKAKPYGVLGKLLPWAGQYKTNGTVRHGKLSPVHHDKISAWRDDKDHLSLDYKNGVLVSLDKVTIENKTEKREKWTLDPVLHKGTIDLVTGIVDMLVQASDKNTCTYAHDVFDGKRRFTLTFRDKGKDTLAKSSLNIYSGPAKLCQLELKPVAGFNGKPRGFYKIQEEARKKGQLPQVWLAPLWQGGPMLPVRMLVKSEYGAIFIHANKVTR